jgi:hypothetical protein
MAQHSLVHLTEKESNVEKNQNWMMLISKAGEPKNESLAYNH